MTKEILLIVVLLGCQVHNQLKLLLTATSSPAELGCLKDGTQRAKAWGMLWNSRGCSPSIGVLEGMQRRTGSGGSRHQHAIQIDPVGTIPIDHHAVDAFWLLSWPRCCLWLLWEQTSVQLASFNHSCSVFQNNEHGSQTCSEI